MTSPPDATPQDTVPADPPMARLLAVMARLRDPAGGCPWDLEQSFESIAPYTIEEAYEVAEAITVGDRSALKDELGDLLLQVVYHARMAEEEGSFGFDEVAAAIADKMIRRHPHVFGDAMIADAAAQTGAWERQKAEERARKAAAEGRTASVLEGVSTALPALMRAVKLQRRAARVGFDWPQTAPVIAKVEEELGELRAEIDAGRNTDRLEDEMGDVLFAVVNLARHLDVDPEAALRRCNAKFERRFRSVEERLAAQGRSPDEAMLEEMEALWVETKLAEKVKTSP